MLGVWWGNLTEGECRVLVLSSLFRGRGIEGLRGFSVSYISILGGDLGFDGGFE
jgi:hypothetical protein